MTVRLIDRFRAGPLGLLRRSFSKVITGPIRYRSSSGYDASRYWRDRFAKYGTSLRGVGDEGLTEEENRNQYETASETLLETISKLDIPFPDIRVLDIGCGSGFYTGKLRAAGVRSYTGVDVTDELFPMLRESFPDYEFHRTDITYGRLAGEYDLILTIDVLEHIVTDSGMRNAALGIKGALASQGFLLLGPVMQRARKHLFYVRFWSLEEISEMFSGLLPLEPIKFRGGYLMPFRRPD